MGFSWASLPSQRPRCVDLQEERRAPGPPRRQEQGGLSHQWEQIGTFPGPVAAAENRGSSWPGRGPHLALAFSAFTSTAHAGECRFKLDVNREYLNWTREYGVYLSGLNHFDFACSQLSLGISLKPPWIALPPDHFS